MIKSVIPKSELLKKYIEVFYVFTEDRPENISYLAFPHTNTAISLFKNVTIKRSHKTVAITSTHPKNQDEFKMELLGKYLEPVLVNYKGHVNEVSIVFKPLGINHFLKEDMSSIASTYSQAYSNTKWIEFMPVFFKSERSIPLLEKFLLSEFHQTHLNKIYLAIDHLEDQYSNESIEKIAELIQMNLKTFQRHFYKALVCSPSNYRRIAKFRQSMRSGLMKEEINKLTELAYHSNYYDQSYFVREYKKLSKLNPKLFFRQIKALDSKNIFWILK